MFGSKSQEKVWRWSSVKLDAMDLVAEEILKQADDLKIFTFHGDLGAGKTTLIKSFCKVLNVVDLVSSPTFSLVNEYSNDRGNTIYHFDLYRIKSVNELFDIGIEEYLDSSNYCFIEWPEKILNLIQGRYAEINIESSSEGREISMSIKS